MEGEKLSVGRSAALIWIPTVARLWKAKPAGVRPCTISASCGIRKNERAKPECPPHAWGRWPPARSQDPLSSFPPTRDHYSRCCRVSRIQSRVYRFPTTKAGMSRGISDIHLLAASHDYKELERWARQRGGNRASKGLEDRRHGPKCANKAIMRREINDLTQKSKPKTKPKQSR